MKIACPRVIRGNRGDLLSRYGILSALIEYGLDDIVVFCHSPADIQGLPLAHAPYGRIYNLFPSAQGLKRLREADTILWTAGLDLQDDSSLVKLLHLYCTFMSYRLLGLTIKVIGQGAGPLTTQWGRSMTRRILNLTDSFLARDPGSYRLIQDLQSHTQLAQGYDGIFFGKFDLSRISSQERELIDSFTLRPSRQPLIGFNIRQWFHFASSLLPYQLANRAYSERSRMQMGRLIEACVVFVKTLRRECGARIILLSAYEPGVEPWEDDLPWLQRVKVRFNDDENVVLVNQPMSLLSFCRLISQLDLMVGVRLHSTLTALRFGVPALNVSYTLKGRDIFNHMGLGEQVISLEDFIDNPAAASEKAIQNLSDPHARQKVAEVVRDVTRANEHALDGLAIW